MNDTGNTCPCPHHQGDCSCSGCLKDAVTADRNAEYSALQAETSRRRHAAAAFKTFRAISGQDRAAVAVHEIFGVACQPPPGCWVCTCIGPLMTQEEEGGRPSAHVDAIRRRYLVEINYKSGHSVLVYCNSIRIERSDVTGDVTGAEWVDMWPVPLDIGLTAIESVWVTLDAGPDGAIIGSDTPVQNGGAS